MLKLFSLLEKAEHVIWDWNGTLLSDVEYAVNTVNTLLKPRGLPLLTVESYQKTFCFPIRKYYEILGFDLKNESFEKLCDTFVDAFMANIHTCDLVPGARDILKRVKSSGKIQSVLSATDQPNLEKMMTSFELKPFFDFVFGIEDKMAASKIHRGHDLLEESQIVPHKTLLIGDTDHDLEVGQALGIPVLLLAHGHQCAIKLRRIHDNVVDISELPDLF
jgi:phosphoglycolate phosphatase